MTFPSILSRFLNMNHHNLGFGGCAKGEDEVADYVASLDASIFIYDYDHNAPNPKHLRDTHEKMFLKFRKTHPNTPVVMMTAPRVVADGAWAERQQIIRETYENAKARGDENVYLVLGTDYFGEVGADYTADGTHPTDMGYYLMAKTLEPVVREALEKTKK
jgi:lysophospholipase L1-like esterase